MDARLSAEAFAAALAGVPWLERCGASPLLPPQLPLGPAGQGLPWRSVPLARVAADAGRWGAVALDARNALTRHLARACPGPFRRWNAVAQAMEDAVVVPLRPVWAARAAALGCGAGVADAVAWDVLGAAMEHAYAGCAGRPAFFTGLLAVYRAGHLPCGWQGRRWPHGTLVVC